MNTLFITYHFLYGNGGGIFASRAYINAFAEISDKITLVYPESESEFKKHLNPKIKYYPLSNISLFKKVIRRISGVFHRTSFDEIHNELLMKNKYDLIVIDNSIIGDLIPRIKQRNCKIICIHHNVQIDYYKDNTNFFYKCLDFNGYFVKKNELISLKYSDINFTLTSSDKAKLIDKYKLSSDINIVNTGCFEFFQSANKNIEFSEINYDSIRFIITGNLGAIQSKNSIIPFLKKYYYIINEIFPNHKLLIAGKNPSEEIIHFSNKISSKISIIPNPVEMTDYLKNADVYICPIFLGSGIKLRVMDGLKYGLPIISHVVSSRGYEVFEENNFLFSYNDENSFREILINLKNNINNISRINIVKTFEDSFSFDSGLERIKKILQNNEIN